MSGTPIREDQQGVRGTNPDGSSLPVPDRRLRRNQRITKSDDFRRIFGGDRSYIGDYMVMWLGASAGVSCRLGVIASKRSFRRAVDRARVKRMLRESFRLNRYRFSGGVDVVLIGRKRILKVSLGDIERDLLRLAMAGGLLSDRPDGAGPEQTTIAETGI